MSRRAIGMLLVVVGAIVMIINVAFLRPNEYYDLVRELSFVLFMVGVFMIPSFSKSNKNK